MKEVLQCAGLVIFIGGSTFTCVPSSKKLNLPRNLLKFSFAFSKITFRYADMSTCGSMLCF